MRIFDIRTEKQIAEAVKKQQEVLDEAAKNYTNCRVCGKYFYKPLRGGFTYDPTVCEMCEQNKCPHCGRYK